MHENILLLRVMLLYQAPGTHWRGALCNSILCISVKTGSGGGHCPSLFSPMPTIAYHDVDEDVKSKMRDEVDAAERR